MKPNQVAMRLACVNFGANCTTQDVEQLINDMCGTLPKVGDNPEERFRCTNTMLIWRGSEKAQWNGKHWHSLLFNFANLAWELSHNAECNVKMDIPASCRDGFKVFLAKRQVKATVPA